MTQAEFSSGNILWFEYEQQIFLSEQIFNETGPCSNTETKFLKQTINSLTHCGLVMPYGDIDLGQQWLR